MQIFFENLNINFFVVFTGKLGNLVEVLKLCFQSFFEAKAKMRDATGLYYSLFFEKKSFHASE